MGRKDLLSIQDLSQQEILFLCKEAKKLKKKPSKPVLKGKLMASCFFEPSTRTRLSFEVAMKRLGGDCVGFADGSNTSLQKGESLSDMMKVISSYVDVVVIRHGSAGSAQLAAESSSKPVLNAGDGTNEHPTQTLTDLFTIQEKLGSLSGLKIAFVGDLLHGRTVHSLALALQNFGARMYFVAPPQLAMPQLPRNASSRLLLEEVLEEVDIIYMTRIQKERFQHLEEYEKVKNSFTLMPELPSKVFVMHPLPRLNEIPTSIDNTPHALYFQQAENGVYMRQALLKMVLEA